MAEGACSVTPAELLTKILCVCIPRKMAPYHTEELFPSVTSPIMDEFGATKMSSASCGFLLLSANNV